MRLNLAVPTLATALLVLAFAPSVEAGSGSAQACAVSASLASVCATGTLSAGAPQCYHNGALWVCDTTWTLTASASGVGSCAEAYTYEGSSWSVTPFCTTTGGSDTATFVSHHTPYPTFRTWSLGATVCSTLQGQFEKCAFMGYVEIYFPVTN